MKFIRMAVFVLLIGMCGPIYAQEDKVKGLDIVSDTAVAVIRKVNAFFQGNLEWTMPPDKGIDKNDYTVDVLGRRVPRSTLA